MWACHGSIPAYDVVSLARALRFSDPRLAPRSPLTLSFLFSEGSTSTTTGSVKLPCMRFHPVLVTILPFFRSLFLPSELTRAIFEHYNRPAIPAKSFVTGSQKQMMMGDSLAVLVWPPFFGFNVPVSTEEADLVEIMGGHFVCRKCESFLSQQLQQCQMSPR